MVRSDVEVAHVVEVATERTLWQRELQAIEEPAIEARDLRFAVRRKRIGGANTRSQLVFPVPLEIDVGSVESRNLLFFHAQTQVQRQPAGRLPFILEEDGVSQVDCCT